MSVNSTLFAFLAVLALTGVVSGAQNTQKTRKLLQGAGVGSGCESVFHEGDNGSGYTVEDTENTLAGDLKTGRKLKQGAGVGAGCNSVLTQADNGSGYTVEDTENTVAGDLGGKPTAGAGTGKKLLAAVAAISAEVGRSLKQLDKMANGAGNVASAAGLPQQGAAVAKVGDDYDGQLTGDSAQVGSQVGGLEASLPEATGALPGRKMHSSPHRALKQLDKMANGAGNVASAAGLPQQGKAVATVGDDYDGQLTNDFAQDGAAAGNLEASLPEATGALPGRKM